MSDTVGDRPALATTRVERLALGAALAVLVAVLLATAVPGVFTVDEDHYLVSVLALREGGLAAPGTGGLPPSRELRWFDPWSHRLPPASPAPTTVPPLYAPLALPFLVAGGWPGLFAFNVLAFAAVGVLVFALARRHSRERATAWIALATYLAGGYSIEYAQGAWPHLVAVLLGFGGFVLAARARERFAPRLAFAAGLAGGLAAGVRYQNVVLALAVGLGLLVFAPRRWRSAALFTAGLALPLIASAAINEARIGAPNPVTKGKGYLETPLRAAAPRKAIGDVAVMAWARVVDFSKRPPIPDPDARAFARRDEATGAWRYGLRTGEVKKAWLQSSPWIVLALVAAFPLRRRFAEWTRAAVGRESAAIGLAVFAVLALFAFAGTGRHDGLSFNQRYFLELVPFAAVAFAWALERRAVDPRLAAASAVAGLAIAGIWLTVPLERTARTLLVLRLPLVLAAALVVAAWAAVRGHRRARQACAVLAGLAVAWALALHLADDLPASRDQRRFNLAFQQEYAAALPPPPERAAIFVYWGLKDGLGPLLVDRDLVVADVHADDGRTMPALIEALHASGRRVFVSTQMPRGFLEPRLAGRFEWRPPADRRQLLIEVSPRHRP